MNHVLSSHSVHYSSKIYYNKKVKKTLLPLVAIAFVVASLLLVTSVHLGIFITGYQIAQLEHQQDQLLRDLQALKLEEAVLKRPERIVKMAREELGLMRASKAPVIR